MIKRLTSRDKKYNIDIKIDEDTIVLDCINIIEDPIVNLFCKSVSFFPIINKTCEADHIELIKKNSLSIDILHKGRFTPFAKNGKISFHVNFLKYLWAMSYSLFSYSHNIIELEYNSEWNGNALELKNSFEIFFMKEWARMLKNLNEYFPWFPHIPNPDFQNEEIKEINSIFHLSIAYIYYHELSHLILKHNCLNNKTTLEQEKEADNNALSIMTDSFTDEKIKRAMGIGSCIAISTLLFLQDNLILQKIKTHPEPDQRLYNVIEFLYIQNPIISDYLKRFVTLIAEFYFHDIGIKLPKQKYSSTDELYEDTFNAFDNMKN